jgi:class III poly(R)-hydroxyalkanoic acid synthase PhaE subunit
MKDFLKSEGDATGVFGDLLGKTSELWGDMTRTFFEKSDLFSKMSADGKPMVFPGVETWETLMNSWQKSNGNGNGQKDFSFAIKGMQDMTESLNKIVKSGLTACVNSQKNWMTSAESINDVVSGLDSSHSGSELFEIFKTIYKKEVGRFFSIPQLGLTRFYQERVIQLIDKFNLFQANLLEFIFLLYLPIGQSFKMLQKTLTSMHEKKALPENFNEYYQMWVKMLEEKYMELFQSTEYVTVLGKAMEALNDFLSARQAITQDFLKMAGIPVEKDLDELYKDIYNLKKRIVHLEKTIDEMSKSEKSDH